MVSGKPPRHSKSNAEPVTIDLDAKDVKEIGKEKDAAAADNTAKPEPDKDAVPAQSAAIDTPKENPKPIWDQEVKKPIEPEPNIHKTDDVKAQPAGAQEPSKTSSVPPFKTETPKPSQTASSSPKVEPSKPAAAETKTSTDTATKPKTETDKNSGNSGLLAAGIVGGLIALLAAGSMQYAGYLPPFSGNAGSSDELATLKTQVAGLREQIANAPQATADTSALETRLAALENSASGGGDLVNKVSALESTVSTLQSEKSAQDTANAELTRRLSAAETKINEPRDDIEVARAIASAGLKAAIDRGGPFLTELDTLSKVTPNDPAIQSLRPFANTGVPSRAELTRNFPDVANAMLGSLNQADPNQGIFDRLTESALSLVKVRPVGNVEGEGPEAKIARMEDKLRNGDLKGAALEWDGLPEPAKTASADFKKSLDARVQVEDLVNGTLTRAITSTGQQG